ncbi:MAG: hypothetical protein U0324_42135 [Polyangiales bacterium]
MSCDTGYLLRDADGGVWFARLKYGPRVAPPRDIWRMVEDRRVPLARAGEGCFDGTCCCGVLLDEVARRYRCFNCWCDGRLRDFADEIRRLAPCDDWDAGTGWGGREEFGALLPEAARLIMPYALPSHVALEAYDRSEWMVGWDPVARELAFREDARWINDPFDLVRVVTPDGDACDYWFRGSPSVDGCDVALQAVVAWLQPGPPIVDALRAAPPYPRAEEEGRDTRHVVVVDATRGELRYSQTGVVPPRLHAAIAASWPGYALRPVDGPLPGGRFPAERELPCG